jgi:hypothetical protein
VGYIAGHSGTPLPLPPPFSQQVILRHSLPSQWQTVAPLCVVGHPSAYAGVDVRIKVERAIEEIDSRRVRRADRSSIEPRSVFGWVDYWRRADLKRIPVRTRSSKAFPSCYYKYL